LVLLAFVFLGHVTVIAQTSKQLKETENQKALGLIDNILSLLNSSLLAPQNECTNCVDEARYIFSALDEALKSNEAVKKNFGSIIALYEKMEENNIAGLVSEMKKRLHSNEAFLENLRKAIESDSLSVLEKIKIYSVYYDLRGPDQEKYKKKVFEFAKAELVKPLNSLFDDERKRVRQSIISELHKYGLLESDFLEMIFSHENIESNVLDVISGVINTSNVSIPGLGEALVVLIKTRAKLAKPSTLRGVTQTDTVSFVLGVLRNSKQNISNASKIIKELIKSEATEDYHMMMIVGHLIPKNKRNVDFGARVSVRDMLSEIIVSDKVDDVVLSSIAYSIGRAEVQTSWMKEVLEILVDADKAGIKTLEIVAGALSNENIKLNANEKSNILKKISETPTAGNEVFGAIIQTLKKHKIKLVDAESIIKNIFYAKNPKGEKVISENTLFEMVGLLGDNEIGVNPSFIGALFKEIVADAKKFKAKDKILSSVAFAMGKSKTGILGSGVVLRTILNNTQDNDVFQGVLAAVKNNENKINPSDTKEIILKISESKKINSKTLEYILGAMQKISTQKNLEKKILDRVLNFEPKSPYKKIVTSEVLVQVLGLIKNNTWIYNDEEKQKYINGVLEHNSASTAVFLEVVGLVDKSGYKKSNYKDLLIKIVRSKKLNQDVLYKITSLYSSDGLFFDNTFDLAELIVSSPQANEHIRQTIALKIEQEVRTINAAVEMNGGESSPYLDKYKEALIKFSEKIRSKYNL